MNMQSSVIKRSIVIAGHKTSVSLEDAFWQGLKEIGKHQRMTLSELVSDIDGRRQLGNLSSSIRLFVLEHFRRRLSEASRYRNNADMDAPQVANASPSNS
jgi:predicted DNA-binding ribbon-helix-helix protein